MTQTQPIVDPPPPRGIALMVATAIFNIVALIFLFLGQITFGEVFVGLALLTALASIFRGGSSTPPTAGNTQSPNTPTNAR
jgi:hypothetical protein